MAMDGSKPSLQQVFEEASRNVQLLIGEAMDGFSPD